MYYNVELLYCIVLYCIVQKAVNLWCNHRPAALKQYGHISNWDSSRVTGMEELFCKQEKFNEDISRWDITVYGSHLD